MNAKAIYSPIIFLAIVLASQAAMAQGQGHGQDRPMDRPQDRAQMERGQHDLDRDRLRDRDPATMPSRDRDRDQDRTHAPDFARLSDHDIYGNELMSMQERNQYRDQLQNAASAAERKQVEEQHREMIQVRARTQGVDVTPPGKGIYGGAAMTVEERNQYREQLRMIDSDEERLQFMAQHREEMQMRAQVQGLDPDLLEETEEAE